MKSVDEVLADQECKNSLVALLKACSKPNNEADQRQKLGWFLKSLEDAEPEFHLPENIISDDAPKKRKRRTKAEMQAAKQGAEDDAKRPLTVQEIAIADANNANKQDQDAAIRHIIQEVIKPNYAKSIGTDGFRHFYINLDRNGVRTPTSGSKWISQLQAAGMPVDPKVFTCVIGDGVNVHKGQMKVSF